MEYKKMKPLWKPVRRKKVVKEKGFEPPTYSRTAAPLRDAKTYIPHPTKTMWERHNELLEAIVFFHRKKEAGFGKSVEVQKKREKIAEMYFLKKMSVIKIAKELNMSRQAANNSLIGLRQRSPKKWKF